MSEIKTFNNLLVDTITKRQARDYRLACSYWIEILDKYLGWILDNELVVVWAQTWIWKSEIAYNISITNARKWHKVLLLALEWDIQEIALRYLQNKIAKKTHLNTAEYRFNIKDYNKYENEALSETEKLLRQNLHVYDKSEIPGLDKVKQLIEENHEKYDMIVIDHLHYINFENPAQENAEIWKAMRTLKQITDQINKPIVLMSHLRKAKEDHDPTIYDLYWSSNIWKEATTCLLLTREKIESWYEEEIQDDKRYSNTKCLVVKNRIGVPYWEFEMIFDKVEKEYLKDYQRLKEESSELSEDDWIQFIS